VRCKVLTVASIKTAVFWVVLLCSVIDVTYVSNVLAASIIRAMITLMVEAASTSEMSVNF
jgi:hypothetical protein